VRTARWAFQKKSWAVIDRPAFCKGGDAARSHFYSVIAPYELHHNIAEPSAEVYVLIEIRVETPGDVRAIRDVNKRAFGQDQESELVDALRSNGAALLSLVAALNAQVVGHIMFSPVSVNGKVTGAALGPMAVLPEHQGQGIGSRLVETGVDKLRKAGCPFIVVVGHANYYPRFGFRPASTRGITCEWGVPDDVFMLLVLDEGKMGAISGLAKYRDEFASLT
jgi:putative acetyltransferase